jgi:hypothetical protein
MAVKKKRSHLFFFCLQFCKEKPKQNENPEPDDRIRGGFYCESLDFMVLMEETSIRRSSVH